jgi:hypothetical protein
MHQLKINQAMALGNGTRRKDEVLATIDGVEPNELLAEAFELVDNDLGKLPGTITPAESVEPIEVLTALRNPRLCEFTLVRSKRKKDDDVVEDAPAESASVDNTEAPSEPAVTPTKPKKPAKARNKK